MKSKVALITGITGQDGAFLAKKLLSKSYKIYGVVRSINFDYEKSNLEKLGIKKSSINFIEWKDIKNLVAELDEVYHLMAISSVAESWKNPLLAYQVNFIKFVELLDILKKNAKIKILNASSSEIFAKSVIKANEESLKDPLNPYGVSKYAAFKHAKIMREAESLFISNAILFNHESELRGESFLFQKIATHVSNLKKGSRGILQLGNLLAQRDWGYAPEYVNAMTNILDQKEADDYVISTGQLHSVKDLVNYAFSFIDIELQWVGSSLDEKAFDSKSGEEMVTVSKEFYRPIENDAICGDNSKAVMQLNWYPSYTVKEILEQMIKFNLSQNENHQK